MPDAMDRVQQHTQDLVDDAMRAREVKPKLPGRDTCANLDCELDISPQRKAMGAQLCIDCQRDEELAAKHGPVRGAW